MNLSTQLINKGYKPELSEGSLVTPIFRTSTFCFPTSQDGKRSFELAYNLDFPEKNEVPSLIYSRVNNPNMEILEERLCLLDNGEKNAVFSSGMGAISNTCLSFLKPGDGLIFTEPVYGGSEYLFNNLLPSYDIICHPIQLNSAPENELKLLINSMNNVKVIFVETPCNPLLKLVSIANIRRIINECNKDILLIVDNTMIGPFYLKPLSLGADLVVYSITKFIGGHSDIVAGGVSGSKKLIDKIKSMRTILGTIPDPDTCWLIQRSLVTLNLRVDKQTSTAKKIVMFLKNHSYISKVYYPGLDNKTKEIFNNEYSDSGSMISFEILGGLQESFKILNNFKIFKLAVSLGSVESLVQHPSSMTHSDMNDIQKRRTGITDSLIRISIGLEHEDDLIEDLNSALQVCM